MPESIRKFSYSVAVHKIAITLLISLALTLFMANAAMDNHQALYFLGRQGTTLLFWGVAALSLVVTAFVAIATYGAIARPPKVALGPAGASVPKASIFGGQIDMAYDSIHEVSRRKVTRRDEMLVIRSTRGESRLLSNHFNPPSEYEGFIDALKEHLMGDQDSGEG